MIIEFDKELKSQKIFANGDELATNMGLDKDERGNRVHTRPRDETLFVVEFENPVLMTDNYKILSLQDTVLRDTVFALYNSSFKRTVYDGVSVDFEQKKFPGVWGPSIDTLLFTRALSKEDLSSFKSGLEIGPGSGFIAKYLLENCSELNSMDLIDLNPDSIRACKYNIEDDRARFFVGDGIEFTKDKSYDVIVCNPPYIDRKKSIDDNAYKGVNLLEYLLNNASDILNENGVLYTNVSSLSAASTKSLIDCFNNKKKVDGMRVPLKVFNVLNNKDWMSYLQENNMLFKNSFEGYDYWHDLSIYAIKNS